MDARAHSGIASRSRRDADFELGRRRPHRRVIYPTRGRSRMPRRGSQKNRARIAPALYEPGGVRIMPDLRRNASIDAEFRSLGALHHEATHQRLTKRIARLPALGGIHPMQPQKTVQGGPSPSWLSFPAGSGGAYRDCPPHSCPQDGVKAACRRFAIRAEQPPRREPNADYGTLKLRTHQSRHRCDRRLNGRRSADHRRWPCDVAMLRPQ